MHWTEDGLRMNERLRTLIRSSWTFSRWQRRMRGREGEWAEYTFTADGLWPEEEYEWMQPTRPSGRMREAGRKIGMLVECFFFDYYYRWMRNLVTCANILKIFNIGHILVCDRNLLNWSLGLAFSLRFQYIYLHCQFSWDRQKFNLRSMPCVTSESGGKILR